MAVSRENALWLVQRNRDTSAVYKWYCVQCCYAALHTVSFVHGCFAGKMHCDWFNGIEIPQGRWQHGEKVGYCYPSRLEKTPCKWDIYVTKGLTCLYVCNWKYREEPHICTKQGCITILFNHRDLGLCRIRAYCCFVNPEGFQHIVFYIKAGVRLPAALCVHRPHRVIFLSVLGFANV